MAHKVGDTVTVTRGPHKGDAHKVIHVHKDGRVNVKPHNKMPHQIKYRHGAATAKADEVKKMKESSMKSFMELSKDTMKSYKKKVTKRIGQHATGEYHPTDNPVKMDWELDQYQDKARVHKKMRDVAKKKIKAKGKNESTISEIARSMTPMRDKFGKSKAEKEAEAKKKESEKDEGTIITKPDFKMKPDDQNKLKKIADLMKKAKATKEACWDSHKQVGYKMKGGRRVPNCVPKNENQQAALQKKLAKSAQSSEKGKKAVTLAKAPFKIPSKNEGAMKRIATSQSNKPDRMAPGKGLDTFKKKPPEQKEVLDKDKDHMSYRQKAKYSMDRARNSATAKIVRGNDNVDKEKNTLRKRAAGMAMSDRKGVRQFRKFHGYDKKK